MTNAAQEKKDEGRSARQQKPKDDVVWKGFVACELTDAQKAIVKAMRQDTERVWGRVIALVDDLYKLSLSVDAYNGMYIASLTCKDKQSRNNGMTLSGRGGSLIGAMAALIYKHDVVLEEDWTNVGMKSVSTPDEDDVG